MNYLTVEVYKNSFGDCTNNGVTSDASQTFVVPCESGPITEEGLDAYGAVYVILVPGKAGNRMHLKPYGVTRHTMFGGNFVYSSDSRFKETYGSNPVHVHDRIEY